MKKNVGIILFIILLDQITKLYIYNTMELGESIKVIDGIFYITFHLNNGAAWGIFSGSQLFLIAITVVVVGFILHFLYKTPDLEKFANLGLCLYVAGAIGNLIDRVRMGAVIDFLDVIFPYFDYDFPIFNVADMSLVIGFGLIFISIVREKKNG